MSLAEAVPKGVPLIDPKCGSNPSSILAGAGVALKAIQALGARLGKPHLWRSLVDLATLGTIADLMPMVDENRALVAEGLSMLNSEPRACIEALMVQAGIEPGTLSSVNLGFTLIPRLKAAGRMAMPSSRSICSSATTLLNACVLQRSSKRTTTNAVA